MSQAVAAIRAARAQGLGPQAQGPARPATDQLLFSKVFNYVSQVLARAPAGAVPAARVAGRAGHGQRPGEGAAGAVVRGGLGAAAGAAGEGPGLRRRQEADPHAPDHFVRWPHVVPTVAELKVVFLAALKLVQPNVPIKQRAAAAVGAVPGPAAQDGAAAADGAAGGGGAAVPRDQGRGGPAQLVERRGLHRHPRRLPDVRRPGRGGPAGADRAGGGGQRRAQGEDPRPHPVDGLRRVLRAARAPGADHRLTGCPGACRPRSRSGTDWSPAVAGMAAGAAAAAGTGPARCGGACARRRGRPRRLREAEIEARGGAGGGGAEAPHRGGAAELPRAAARWRCDGVRAVALEEAGGGWASGSAGGARAGRAGGAAPAGGRGRRWPRRARAPGKVAGAGAEALRRRAWLEAEIEEARAAAAQLVRQAGAGARTRDRPARQAGAWASPWGASRGHYLTERHQSVVAAAGRADGARRWRGRAGRRSRAWRG